MVTGSDGSAVGKCPYPLAVVEDPPGQVDGLIARVDDPYVLPVPGTSRVHCGNEHVRRVCVRGCQGLNGGQQQYRGQDESGVPHGPLMMAFPYQHGAMDIVSNQRCLMKRLRKLLTSGNTIA